MTQTTVFINPSPSLPKGLTVRLVNGNILDVR